MLVGWVGAADALEWPGRARAVAARVERAVDPTERAEALSGFRGVDASDAEAPLAVAMADPDATVRAAAVEVAGQIGAIGLVDALVERLADRRALVRAAACEALGALRARDARDPIARALGDRDASVRRAAVSALAALGGADSLVAITEAVNDRSREVVVAALGALGVLGQPGSAYAVLERAGDPNSEIALAAIDALVALRDPVAVGVLGGLLSDSRADVARAAFDALGELGDEAAVPALVGHVISPRIDGGAGLAVSALVRIGSPRAVEPLAPLLRTDPARVADYFASVGQGGWYALRDAAARVDVGDVAQSALLTTWLRSGDPMAVERALQRFEGDELVTLLRESPTARAFCHALELRRAVVGADGIDEWARWGARSGGLDCLAPVIRGLSALDRSSAIELVRITAPVSPALAAEVSSAHLDTSTASWEELGSTLAGLGGDADSLALAGGFLAAEDARLRREAVWVLERAGGAGESLVAQPGGGSPRTPELVRALDPACRAGDASARARVAALASGGTPEERAVALDVAATWCGVDPETVQRAARSADYWLRRAALQHARQCGLEVVPAAEARDPVSWRAGLAGVPADELEAIAAAGDRGSWERLAALDALRARAPERAVELAERLIDAPDPLVAAGALSLVPRDRLTTHERLATAMASRSPVERAALLAPVVGDAPSGLEHVRRRETDAGVLRVVDGAAPYAGPVDVFTVDAQTGQPRRDETVFALLAGGGFELARTGADGRALLSRSDVLAVFVVEPRR